MTPRYQTYQDSFPLITNFPSNVRLISANSILKPTLQHPLEKSIVQNLFPVVLFFMLNAVLVCHIIDSEASLVKSVR